MSPGTKEFLQGVRRLCTKHDIMMIMDEIQCGMGRTGKMFSYMHYDFKPDISNDGQRNVGNGA
ncbi:MAG: aminotransferase class III-fold pyridoxal phosphate-dependent enzyme [Eubacterium sp.]